MSTYNADYWTALQAILIAQLPGITAAKIFRSSSINRANWENLINSATLTAPYCVVEIGNESPIETTMDANSFRAETTIYYIVNLNDSGAAVTGGFDPQGYVAACLDGVKTALIRQTSTAFQCLGQHPTTDYSEFNPANSVFIELLANKYAGMLSFSPIIGEVI